MVYNWSRVSWSQNQLDVELRMLACALVCCVVIVLLRWVMLWKDESANVVFAHH